MANEELKPKKSIVYPDPWISLKAYTNARIALGRAGVSIPIKENLQFNLAHALARDAVYATLDYTSLIDGLSKLSMPILLLKSKCSTRIEYLQRPDFGRKLHDKSINQILETNFNSSNISIIIADGLSSSAINEHIVPVLNLLVPLLKNANYSIAQLVIVEQGRVAIADEIGQILKADMTIIFIGERPGLSAPNSMGAYLTFNPQIGNTDEKRNCVSNIRPEGLNYTDAVDKIFYLINASFEAKLSGVNLKDEFSKSDMLH